MEEKLMMNNVLTLTKNLCDILMHATIEAPNHHKSLRDTLSNFLDIQNNIYMKMTEKGWYQIKNVEQSKIEQTKSNYEN